MPPAFEVLLLNTAIPQIQAAQSGDTYVVPRDIAFSTVASFAAGAEATPSIVATGDTNTGIWFPAADTVAISTGGISRLRLDSSGNLGLGVTPSAWASTHKAYQLSGGGGLYNNGADGYLNLANNFYYDGADWRRVTAAPASTYLQSSSGHLWGYVGTGTANSVCGFPSAQMALDTSGNLGLGVTPSVWNTGYKAFVAGGTNANNQVGGIASGSGITIVSTNYYRSTAPSDLYAGDGFAMKYTQSSGQHIWETAASGTAGNAISFTQAMTLDASGRLLVGPTSDIAAGGYFGVGQFRGSFPALVLSGTEASAKTWQIGENAGALTFYNTTDGERARITSGGNFLVGTDNSAENAGLGMKVLNTGGTVALVSAASDSSQQGFEMYSTTAAAYRLYINYAGTINATSTTISAISDQRLKENIQDLDVGLDKIMALKPRKFDWKTGKGKDIKGDRGWIAQEFEQVFPDLIDEWRDPAPEGEEPYKSVRADLIPVLVKAIQEQQAMINELKAEVAALKGA